MSDENWLEKFRVTPEAQYRWQCAERERRRKLIEAGAPHVMTVRFDNPNGGWTLREVCRGSREQCLGQAARLGGCNGQKVIVGLAEDWDDLLS